MERISEKEFNEKKYFGIAMSVDLYKCSPEKIRSADEIKKFVRELCEMIKMNRYGETVVVHFGSNDKVEGFSMTQLIDSSLISGHFANSTNATYLDIFSCRYYDANVVADFAKKFFEAKEAKSNVVLRK
jgi:S-adenosylmethionine/arginine decarboxylase-like enzyme